MPLRPGWAKFLSSALLLLSLPAVGQGTLEDYQRAVRFLPGNLRHKVFPGDVSPHWVDKTDRFWYRRLNPKGADFVLVDADQNKVSPAFDHGRLAAALSADPDVYWLQRTCGDAPRCPVVNIKMLM